VVAFSSAPYAHLYGFIKDIFFTSSNHISRDHTLLSPVPYQFTPARHRPSPAHRHPLGLDYYQHPLLQRPSLFCSTSHPPQRDILPTMASSVSLPAPLGSGYEPCLSSPRAARSPCRPHQEHVSLNSTLTNLSRPWTIPPMCKITFPNLYQTTAFGLSGSSR